jgi:aspartyl protease family protein
MPRLLVLPALLVASMAAQAQSVMVMSLGEGRVQLLVNGSVVRELRAGQASPEGIRLLSADRTRATLVVDGKELVLGLGGSTVATAELHADARGHFMTLAYINGVPTQAVVDTGATLVALSRDEARRIGVGDTDGRRVRISTAGGPRTGSLVTLARVRVGGVALQDVEAIVLDDSDLAITLIGMSFLNGVDMRRAGNTLTLSRRQF